jgi:hypothetical protein
MEPAEMAALVTETERACKALGGIQYGPTEAEMPASYPTAGSITTMTYDHYPRPKT